MISFHLTIITINGLVFEGDIKSLVATGISGSLGILSQHAPMVVGLKNGPLKITHNGPDQFFSVTSGVLEVDHRSDCLILADFAYQVDSLDEAKIF